MAQYNIVDQGADNTGSNPIDPTLDDLVGSGDTVYFPEGQYLLNSLVVGSGVTNFTLKGSPNATLIPQDYGSNATNLWWDVTGDGFVADQFGIDVHGRNPGTMFVGCNDFELTRLATHGEVHCETDGQAPGDSTPSRTWLRPEVPDSGHSGLIEDCYFHDGSNQSVSQGSNRRAILVEKGSGDLTINRCWFERWGENTIYAKNPRGKVTVLNSFVKNSQNGIRTGGNTEIHNTLVIQNERCPPNWADSQLQRGIQYEADEASSNGPDYDTYSGTHSVTECDFVIDAVPDNPPQYPGAAIGGSAVPERAEVINCRIYYRSNRSDGAIYNGDSTDQPARYWAFDDVHITHNGVSGQYHIEVNATPDNWGAVNGVLGGSDSNYSNSAHVRNNMILGGSPDPPNTTRPMPDPPADSNPR
ncbi:hypothetical protein ACFFQF_00965 [Haladaptatus pallidirubidus]|uniref:hypothetical protein n=1 Tax=Haladaptatus pallidirubidus TaxID=1008152 RepID=UPI0035E67F68